MSTSNKPGKPENSDNLDKPEKPKKPEKAKVFSKQFIDSTIPPIVKNELTVKDLMKETNKGDIVSKSSIDIAEALLNKTDFQNSCIFANEKKFLYLYREDKNIYQKYTVDEVKIIIVRMFQRFPYPALRANTLLNRIYDEFVNSKITGLGSYPTEGDSSMDR